jgi:hypothetical protein
MSSAVILGSEVRSRYLPSRFSSDFALTASILRRPPGDPQVPVQAGLGGDDASQLGPLVLAEGVGAVDEFLELDGHAGADRGVPLGPFGVVADDEPLVLGDPHLLDPQARGDFLVAALA